MPSDSGHIDFSVHPVMRTLPTITLAEMDSIGLMNRIDTKYVTHENILVELLREAALRGYRVLETSAGKSNPYDSVYFDTESLEMYRMHLHRKLVRQKIRTRMYVNSGQTFLEIKKKNNRGRTRKKRMEVSAEVLRDFRGDAGREDFITRITGYPAGELHPSVETMFRRITLVNASKTERLTIDTDLRFVHLPSGNERTLGNAVVIELKQDGRAASEMKGILLDLRVKPLRMSKYCIGTALTDPQAPKHRFKLKIRKIEKIINQSLT